jgi:hypothetical protein
MAPPAGQSPHSPTRIPQENPGRQKIRTTYQLAAKVPIKDVGPEKTIEQLAKSIMHWFAKRLPERLPQEAWEGQTFEAAWPGMRVEAIWLPELASYAFRLEHPDMPHKGKPAAPGRTWTVDIAFSFASGELEAGIRSYCASLPSSWNSDVALTRPRIVVDFAKRHGLHDEWVLSQNPWFTESESQLDDLYRFVLNPNRRLPIVVLTQPDKAKFSVHVDDFLLDPCEIARRCCGIAHVVQLPRNLAFKWTELVGKPWSVFLGAVRTYMPGLDFDEDLPMDHPTTFAEKILFWRGPGDNSFGEAAFTEFLVNRLFYRSIVGRPEWGKLLFLEDLRGKSAEISRKQSSDQIALKSLYEEEIESLNKKIAELLRESEEYSSQAIQFERERDAYLEDNHHLRAQVESLRQALEARSGGADKAEIPIPDSFNDMLDWVEEHLSERLVLHPRATRGLKRAAYEDVGLVYKSLLLLANEYRDQCLGRDGSKDKFKRECGRLGLKFTQSISEKRAGELGDEYYVHYPSGSSKRQFLEWHLSKGNNRDERRCLRVYLFWHAETEQVVVGWLPSHLTNRMS